MAKGVEYKTQLLQRMPIFGGIEVAAIEVLLERTKTVSVKAGDYFFREGSSGTSAYVLEDGRVSILKYWQDDDYLLHELESGSCFGEVSLLDFGLRSASVRADVDCRAMELTTLDLFEICKSAPKQFALIYMNLGREVSRRLRAADERLFEAIVIGHSIAENYSIRSD